MRRALLAVLVVVAAAAAPPRGAAAVAWHRAPIYGGDIRSLAIDPRDPDTVLAGTSAGQVYRSRDGGASWGDAGAEVPLPGWVVAALHFDANRPGRVWASLWGLWGGGLVTYSDDLGLSWVQPHAPFPEHQIYTLATVPGAPGRLYAGTRAGVLRSSDDGATWALATAAYPEIVNVSSLYVDPAQPASLIAGTWRRAYRSDDGGTTWRGIFTGMIEDTEVFTLNPVAGSPGELWASTCGWVYQTRDGGEHWTRFQKGLDERRTPAFRVLADGRLLAGTVAGAYVSADRGASWTRITPAGLSVLAVAQSPARPERLLLGTEGGGVWRSDDGGATFSPANRGLYNVRVMALVKNGPEIVAGVNHAGPASGVYSSFDRGASFSFAPTPLPTLLDLGAARGRLLAATEGGLFARDAGAWRAQAPLAGRVEQVLAAGERVVARAAGGLFEWREPSNKAQKASAKAESKPGAKSEWVAIPYKHGAPRSAALFDDALWVTDATSLYRLDGKSNHTVATPVAGGRLARVGGELLLASPRGAWTRTGLAGDWTAIASGATRVFETGDAAHPVVLVNGDRATLWSASAGAAQSIDLPFPARDLATVLLDGGTLYVGSSGHGLWAGDLAQSSSPAP